MVSRRIVASLMCLCLLLAQFIGSGMVVATAAQGSAAHAHHAAPCDDPIAGGHDCSAALAPDNTGDDCPMTTGGCCPAPAVTRSVVAGDQAPSVVDETIAFRTSLHLLSRAEGIFKPPRSLS